MSHTPIPHLQKITIVDVDLPDPNDVRVNTRIHGDATSVCFDTTNHEGNIREPSFELTWKEIFAACKEYMK
jgi:tRNA(Ser,Leu) C12 N-acetylase TAN1